MPSRCPSVRPPAAAATRGISKPHSSTARGDALLIGRRINVPQRFTEVEDDGDGFTFGAVITGISGGLSTIKFDYTGEIERWPLRLVRTWLSIDADPLCDLFDKL